MNFKSKRITRNYRQIINSTPDVIFPLLCPVKEKEWLDGWDCNMIYSESGVAEPGAVFCTSHQGEKDTVWIISKHDQLKKAVQFARVTPDSKASLLYIFVLPKDESSSFVDITYTYTAISKSGNKSIDEFTEEAFLKMIKFWEDSMNYYLENGKKQIRKH